MLVVGLHQFAGFAGTETYALTVAAELQRLGHEVVVHAPTTGAIAKVAGAQGIPVVRDPQRLPDAVDGVLSQDAATAFALAARYPHARRLLVVHSDFFALQSPPQLTGVCDTVVVMNDRVGRYVAGLAAAPEVARLRQPVDLLRFGPRGREPDRARTVLVLGNYLAGDAASRVEAACRAAGLEPVFAGVHATPSATPERAIADADAVIGLGRCVVEAMAGGRAAYVYGIAGGDGWVTPERYAALEADGFAGTATPVVVDAARLEADLRAWDPGMGEAGRQLAAAHHDVAAHARELVGLLREGEPVTPPPAPELHELARLVRMEWQTWSRFASARDEVRALRRELERTQALARDQDARAAALEHELEQAWAVAREREVRAAVHERDLRLAAEAHEAAQARLDALQRTRRYRLATRLGAPLDVLRRRTGR